MKNMKLKLRQMRRKNKRKYQILKVLFVGLAVTATLAIIGCLAYVEGWGRTVQTFPVSKVTPTKQSSKVTNVKKFSLQVGSQSKKTDEKSISATTSQQSSAVSQTSSTTVQPNATTNYVGNFEGYVGYSTISQDDANNQAQVAYDTAHQAVQQTSPNSSDVLTTSSSSQQNNQANQTVQSIAESYSNAGYNVTIHNP